MVKMAVLKEMVVLHGRNHCTHMNTATHTHTYTHNRHHTPDTHNRHKHTLQLTHTTHTHSHGALLTQSKTTSNKLGLSTCLTNALCTCIWVREGGGGENKSQPVLFPTRSPLYTSSQAMLMLLLKLRYGKR